MASNGCLLYFPENSRGHAHDQEEEPTVTVTFESCDDSFIEIEQQFEKLVQQVSDIQDAKIQSLITELRKDINKLLDEKDKHIKSLKTDVEKLRKKVNDLQRNYDLLYLGQAASYFEQAICSHVLPEVFTNDAHATLKKLLNYLNGGRELPLEPEELDEPESRVIQKAKLRWNGVCDKLKLPGKWKEKPGNWKPDDRSVPQVIRAIGLLKQNRVSVAHPSPINLTIAEQKVTTDTIEASMPPWQYRLVKKFVHTLRANITSTRISHKELTLS